MDSKRRLIIAGFFRDLSMFRRSAWQKAFKRNHDIASRTRLGFLFVLSHKKDCNPKDLAEQFGLTPSAATQALDELEQEGLVARKVDKADRRKIRLLVTPKGRTKLTEMKRVRFAQINKVLDVLSNDELLQLRNIEQKVLRRFQELEDEAAPGLGQQ